MAAVHAGINRGNDLCSGVIVSSTGSEAQALSRSSLLPAGLHERYEDRCAASAQLFDAYAYCQLTSNDQRRHTSCSRGRGCLYYQCLDVHHLSNSYLDCSDEDVALSDPSDEGDSEDRSDDVCHHMLVFVHSESLGLARFMLNTQMSIYIVNS